MAIGLPPTYSEDFIQDHLTQQQFLMLALSSVQQSGWNIQYFSHKGLIAFVRNREPDFDAVFKIIIENSKAVLSSSSTGNKFYDSGKNKKTVRAFIARFEEIKQYYSLEDLDMRYGQISESIIPDSGNILRHRDPTSIDVFKDFLSVFKPAKNYFFTPILLNINIFVFILMSVSGVDIMKPTSNDLLAWGANHRPVTMAGEWWRLITSCFIHIGIPHLLMNMYALLYIGLMIEPILGRVRFITAYLLTGVIASLTSLWWQHFAVSAGASGAIFGMYGVFLALLTTSVVEKSTRRPLFISIAIFVIYNLMSGIKSGGVDNAAHVGGIVSGIVIGYVLLPGLKKKIK